MLRNFPRLDESKVLAPADDPVGIVDGQQVNLGIRPNTSPATVARRGLPIAPISFSHPAAFAALL